MLQTYLFGSKKPKTDSVFTPNSIFHKVSHLSDHLDKASHHKIAQFVLSFTRIILLKLLPKTLQNLFHDVKK